MWNRTSPDPLARLLFDKYDVHVLSRPRATLPVLTVFAVRDDKVYLGGTLASLLRVPFDPPEITKGEPVLDISTTVSSATSGSGALNFLKGFLATIGGAIGVSMGAATAPSSSRPWARAPSTRSASSSSASRPCSPSTSRGTCASASA